MEKSFLVEGQKNIAELIQSDFNIKMICGTREFLLSNEKSLQPYSERCYEVGQDELTDMGTFQTNQDGLAVVEMKNLTIGEIRTDAHIIALDGISDPGNLGTIIRTMDWFGFKQLVCSPETTDFYNPKVINSTMGSFARIHCVYQDVASLIARSRLPAYGADLDGEPMARWKPQSPVILVMGSESHGLSTSIQRLLTGSVSIRKFGQAESLNVAIATGIFCHHLRS